MTAEAGDRIDEALSYRGSPEYARRVRASGRTGVLQVAPYQLSLAVGGPCNSPCGYCTNWMGRDPAPSTDMLLEGISQAHALGVTQVLFSGGEPTLRPDLIDIMQAVKDRGMDVLLITNGIRLDAEYVERLRLAGWKKMDPSRESLE